MRDVAFKKYFIGRSPGNDIVLSGDTTVSSIHAMVMTEDGVRFELRDLSANGTFLETPTGDELVGGHCVVSLDDRLVIGQSRITVQELLARAGVHSHLFISYSRSDREKAQTIASNLREQGLRVWWDDELAFARPYDEQLEEKIRNSSAVLVLWSSASITSTWVRAEAGVGLERGVLMPVFIEKVEAPLLFRQLQGHSVLDWTSPALEEALVALGLKIRTYLKLPAVPA